jgi:hypothetical protein
LILQLAAALLSLFDPTVDPVKDQQDAEIRLIPTYRSPKLYGALLPGLLSSPVKLYKNITPWRWNAA